jgi:hypothetical protein
LAFREAELVAHFRPAPGSPPGPKSRLPKSMQLHIYRHRLNAVGHFFLTNFDGHGGGDETFELTSYENH